MKDNSKILQLKVIKMGDYHPWCLQVQGLTGALHILFLQMNMINMVRRKLLEICDEMHHTYASGRERRQVLENCDEP